MTLPSDESCIFCKIVAGQIPASTVFEDEHLMAFLDIGPATHGHTLVVPKGHYESLADLPPDLAAAIGRTLPRLARAVVQATDAEGLNLVNNNGAVAGQSVFHVHFHLVPRFRDDDVRWPWPSHPYDDDAQRDGILEAIRKAL